jgi:hemolysin-activating ACP:hemolysin acyltransferase
MAKDKSLETIAPDRDAAQEIPGELPKEVQEKIAELRSGLREAFGKVVMALMVLPRYRHQTLADLQHMVLEPLIRDRIALAKPANASTGPLIDFAGIAVWASVSEEVDAKIREQIKVGVFPIRLKPEDWTSGEINWLLDVIAPDKASTGRVLANFGQVVKDGDLRLHPLVAGLVDEETARRLKGGKPKMDA